MHNGRPHGAHKQQVLDSNCGLVLYGLALLAVAFCWKDPRSSSATCCHCCHTCLPPLLS
jgi:hypothetical protein